jgi:hypothetical protein
MLTGNAWVFIVDTNQRAGNFVAALCAYCTGVVDDSFKENSDLVLFRALYLEQHGPEPMPGVYREFRHWKCPSLSALPYGVWLSANGDYNSAAIYFSSRPAEEDLTILRQRVRDFTVAYPKRVHYGPECEVAVMGTRLLRISTTVAAEEM